MLRTVCTGFYYYWNMYLSECHLPCTVYIQFSMKHIISISTIFSSFPNITFIMKKPNFKDDCWRYISSVMPLLVFKLMILLKCWLYYRWPYPLLSGRVVTKETYSKRNMTGNKLEPHPSYRCTGWKLRHPWVFWKLK